jgi:hypothetical protein
MIQALGLCLGALLGQLLLGLEQQVELLLVEVTELLGQTPAVVDPQTHGRFQSAGDVQQGTLVVVSDSQIQGAVQLAALAATGGFATGAAALDQRAAQERLLGDQLGESAAGVAFGGGACGSLAHRVSSSVLT